MARVLSIVRLRHPSAPCRHNKLVVPILGLDLSRCGFLPINAGSPIARPWPEVCLGASYLYGLPAHEAFARSSCGGAVSLPVSMEVLPAFSLCAPRRLPFSRRRKWPLQFPGTNRFYGRFYRMPLKGLRWLFPLGLLPPPLHPPFPGGKGCP